ncbi:MAG: FHA domain-containing protein [Acidobacteriota bacterium]
MNEMYSILVAGLNPSEEKFARSHFSKMGHEVIAARNPAEARSEMNDRGIDLAYLRISEGDKPAVKIKELFASDQPPPFVFVCDRAVDGFILEAWRCGASDILVLPLTTESLNASLQRSSIKVPTPTSDADKSEQATFFYLDESGKECRVKITPPRFTIGRSSSNSLVIGQRGVSRSHAEIFRQSAILGSFIPLR